jgi:Fur family ferric uptake transcriptional regulator
MIQKLELAGTRKRFDGYTENHYHVRCVECGRVDDVSLEPIPVIEQAAQGVTDYEVLTYRLEFFGVCTSCNEKKRSHSRSFGDRGPSGDAMNQRDDKAVNSGSR